jgi:hypothetical protein
MSRRQLFPLILAGLLLMSIEGLAFAVGSYLESRHVFYRPPSVESYARYMTERHPVLGWPTRSALVRLDPSGSHPIPAFPEPGQACVSLYGDSFTASAPVSHADGWANVLSRQLGCRVANYGIAAYGTDQAYLRFMHNRTDEAPVAVLVHFVEDVRRNVNQLRNLISQSQAILFKPRFVLDRGELLLVPLPAPSREETEAWITNPSQHLTHEYFAPGGASGISRLRFPFSLSVLRAFGNEHVRAKLAGVTVRSRFYDATHPSGALALTAAILLEFQREALSRGKRPVLVVLPGGHDVERFEESGVWDSAPLIAKSLALGVTVHHLGPRLVRLLAGRNICEFTAEHCYAHYNEEGYALVARAVEEILRETRALDL